MQREGRAGPVGPQEPAHRASRWALIGSKGRAVQVLWDHRSQHTGLVGGLLLEAKGGLCRSCGTTGASTPG